jgi:hypothetical protein
MTVGNNTLCACHVVCYGATTLNQCPYMCPHDFVLVHTGTDWYVLLYFVGIRTYRYIVVCTVIYRYCAVHTKYPVLVHLVTIQVPDEDRLFQVFGFRHFKCSESECQPGSAELQLESQSEAMGSSGVLRNIFIWL